MTQHSSPSRWMEVACAWALRCGRQWPTASAQTVPSGSQLPFRTEQKRCACLFQAQLALEVILSPTLPVTSVWKTLSGRRSWEALMTRRRSTESSWPSPWGWCPAGPTPPSWPAVRHGERKGTHRLIQVVFTFVICCCLSQEKANFFPSCNASPIDFILCALRISAQGFSYLQKAFFFFFKPCSDILVTWTETFKGRNFSRRTSPFSVGYYFCLHLILIWTDTF